MKEFFFDRTGELRVGWRLMAFTLLAGLLIFLTLALYSLVPVRSRILAGALVLAPVLGATYVMTRFVNRKPFGAVGLWLGTAARETGVGVLTGFLMMTAIFVVQYPLGFLELEWRGLSEGESLLIIVNSTLLFAVSAMGEEVVFRGYFFQTLIQAVTLLPAMFLMAVFFGIAHLGNPHVTAFALVNIGLASLWLSIAYYKTRGLWLPFGLHFGWNFSQTTVYSFPTSGVSFEGERLFNLVQSGPDWLTGGSFGPEGGLLATLALVGGTWYVLKAKSLVPSQGMITLDSVEDLVPPAGARKETPGSGANGEAT